MIKSGIGTACLALVTFSTAHAQAVLSGFVRADSTGEPLSDVEVILERSGHRATTGKDGKFVISRAPIGAHVAVFRAVGWRPIRLQVQLVGEDTVWAEVTLVRLGVHLPTVEVEASNTSGIGVRDGFHERKRLGFGEFIDSTELRRLENFRLPDVLQRYNVALLKTTGAAFAVSRSRPGCYMQVLLDGMPLYRSDAPSSVDTARHPPPDLNRDFDVASLSAVEVYRSAADTPSEFGGAGAACGTIVLWSRRN